MRSEENEVPTKDVRDTVYKLTKSGIASVPILGTVASELFTICVTPPLETRRINWMNSLAKRLKEIESKIDEVDIESLKDNPEFITTIMHASKIGIRNHQKEKLEALQNVVLNTALNVEITESYRTIFIQLIDQITPLHIRVLYYFSNPKKWFMQRDKSLGKTISGSYLTPFKIAFRDYEVNSSVYEFIINDLHSKGTIMMNRTNLGSTSAHKIEMLKPLTTPFGNSFINYISEPDI